MNKPKYVFSQLVAFMDANKFRHIVDKYDGNRYVKHFTCWNQLLTLMFGQLGNRESLRDLITIIEAHHQKCYHLGLGKHVTRSNLAKANTNRDYRIFEDFAYYLVSEARRKRMTDIFKLDGNVYAFDSTTISLCLDVFWWAKFRKHKRTLMIIFMKITFIMLSHFLLELSCIYVSLENLQNNCTFNRFSVILRFENKNST